MLNQEQLQRLLKPEGNQCVLINLPNLRALLNWPLITWMTLKILSPKAEGLREYCVEFTQAMFPLWARTLPNTSAKGVLLTANKKRQQREGLSETGGHTYFLRTSHHGPRDVAGTFSKTHKVPHPARTCQFFKSGNYSAVRVPNLLVL